jgi:DNA-damage-inducible protein D
MNEKVEITTMSNDTLEGVSFEDLRHENGVCYWWARDVMLALGYDDWRKFEKVMDKAIKTCMNLENVEHHIEFRYERRVIDETENSVQDCKLSRFACLLVAMNGDTNIPQVAGAQAYFANLAEQQVSIEDVDRLSIRKELSVGFTTLNSAFKHAGGDNYAMFNHAGFVAMYNMSKEKATKRKGISDRDFYELMGRAELAANLFRVTMTESRIKTQGVRGQKNLEGAHSTVGFQVRQLVIENEGRPPESLPASTRSIPQVKRTLQKGRKQLENIDKPKKLK